MPTAVVGDDAGSGEVEAAARTEELHAEQGGGDGGVGGGGEDGNEPDGGKQVDGRSHPGGQGIAEPGTNEEERGDFATLEAGRQGDDGKGQLPSPSAGGNFA